MATAKVDLLEQGAGTQVITRQRVFVVTAFLLLLMLAAGMRLLTFDRVLPYIDVHEESWFYLLTQAWRGAEDVPPDIVERLAGYAPLYLWVNMGLQAAFETLTTKLWLMPSDYIYAARGLAAVTGVLTTAIMIHVGWQSGGPVAGWVAGFAWGFSPVIVDHNSRAIVDPLVYLGCAAAIAMAIRAWHRQSPGWLFGSFLFGIGVIYTKYWPLQVFIPWGIAAVVMTLRQPRRILPWIGAQLVVGVVTGGLLFSYYSSSQLGAVSPEFTNFSNTGFANLFNLSRNVTNALVAVDTIGRIPVAAILTLSAAAYAYSRHRQRLTIADGSDMFVISIVVR